jgi:hypothetical protein
MYKEFITNKIILKIDANLGTEGPIDNNVSDVYQNILEFNNLEELEPWLKNKDDRLVIYDVISTLIISKSDEIAENYYKNKKYI